MSATVKELLKLDSICQSYVQIKKGPVFLTHSVYVYIPLCSAVVHNTKQKTDNLPSYPTDMVWYSSDDV